MRFTAIMLLSLALVSCAHVEPQAQLIQTPGHAVYTTLQADRGKRLYVAQCASCHGLDLMGKATAPVRPVVEGMPTHTPALAGSEFSSNWDGLPVSSLCDRIRISMPRGNPGTLSRTQTADIAAYLFSANGYPAGSNELPDLKQELDNIRIGR